MAISSALYASVRTNARRSYTGSTSQEVDMNRGGDLYVAQGLPDRTSIVSMGGSWVTQILTASAVVPVAAIPTTAANLQLYNGATAAQGISLVIDSVFAIVQTSSGAADFYSLLGQIVGAGVAAAPSAHLSIVSSMSGKIAGSSTYPGVVTRGLSVTTAVANQWFALGVTQNTAALTATAGLTMDYDCYGKYIVQPTGSFFVTGMSSTGATGKLVIGVRWHEVVLDLG